MADSQYQYFAASTLMEMFGVDVATARKIKTGEVDPAELKAKPQSKKHKDKTDENIEVTNG